MDAATTVTYAYRHTLSPHAALPIAVGAATRARRVWDDARLDRARRGWADPPADRASAKPARDARSRRLSPVRYHRDRRMLAARARSRRRSVAARAHPAEFAAIAGRRQIGRAHV